jgi:hypothetical protein
MYVYDYTRLGPYFDVSTSEESNKEVSLEDQQKAPIICEFYNDHDVEQA